MDAQLKRGMLEACVLAVLENGRSYGYLLIKEVGGCIDISESTLYPILRRLEVAGQLTVTTAEHNGRLRKYYEITASGREKLSSFRDEWQEVMGVYNFINGGAGCAVMGDKVKDE